jgi:hypothetical protein
MPGAGRTAFQGAARASETCGLRGQPDAEAFFCHFQEVAAIVTCDARSPSNLLSTRIFFLREMPAHSRTNSANSSKEGRFAAIFHYKLIGMPAVPGGEKHSAERFQFSVCRVEDGREH